MRLSSKVARVNSVIFATLATSNFGIKQDPELDIAVGDEKPHRFAYDLDR